MNAVDDHPHTRLHLPGANRLWLRVAVLIIGALMLSRHLTGPFTGKHEFNSAMYSIFGRNHLRYGLAYTKGFCTWGEGPTPPAEPHRYLNHPPLIAAWSAGAFALFGVHEWAARLVAIAATLGGAALLMRIVSRLIAPAVGVLAGVFYVTLPITTYFGQMLDHVAFVQFFSLLMMHGYLLWSGGYGHDSRRRRGALWYTLGAVLGIGTGWGTVFMAGLLVLLEIGRRVSGRMRRRGEEGEIEVGGEWARGRVGEGEKEESIDTASENESAAQRNFPPSLSLPLSPAPTLSLPSLSSPAVLWALIFIPGAALAAFVVHILWGFEWDGLALVDLFWSRAGEVHTPMPWGDFLRGQTDFWADNYTWAGAVAAVIWLGAALWATCGRGRARMTIAATLGDAWARFVIAVFGVHGVLYVLAFRWPAERHEYWQFFAAPFVAVAMASTVAWAYSLLSSRPRFAAAVAFVLVALPMPGFMFGRDAYYRAEQMPERYIEPYRVLAGLVPPGSPAMTSRDWPVNIERFGRHANRWGVAQILFYADRPLIHTRNLDDITANLAGCSAYVLEYEEEPEIERLQDALSARYASVRVGHDHVIFLLHRALTNAVP